MHLTGRLPRTLRPALLLLAAGLSALVLASCTNIFFQPSHQIYPLPIPEDISKQELVINSSDGTELACWLLLPRKAKPLGTVLFLHGNAENLSTHMGATFWLVRAGYRVFGVDYRGYGLSGGVVEIDGAHRDAAAALRAAALLDPESPLIVFGQSLGGSMAIYTVANYEDKGRIRALIVDSAFAGYRRIAREKLGSLALTWPLQWPLSFLLIRDGYSAERWIDRIAPVPLVLLHGTSDMVVPFHHSGLLYRAAPEHGKTFIKTEAPGHIRSLREESARKSVLELIK